MKHQPAILRNGTAATLYNTIDGAGDFTLIGVVGLSLEVHVWKKSGAWREDDREHPLDITHVVTPCGKRVPLKAQK